MRCPKCGYISFDHLERCKKCHKSFSGYDSGLNGTIYDAEPPNFLKAALVSNEPDSPPQDPAEIEIPDIDTEEIEETFDLEETGGESFASGGDDAVDLEEFILDNEDGDEDAGVDDAIMSLDELEEDNQDEFVALEPDTDTQDDSEGINIDFGDLDITDLKPPASDQDEPVDLQELDEDVEETDLESIFADNPDEESEEDPVAAAKEEEAPAKGGLEDLLLGELDLDKTDLPEAEGEAIEPVKTGTALDSFEVDLGELFAEEKE